MYDMMIICVGDSSPHVPRGVTVLNDVAIWLLHVGSF